MLPKFSARKHMFRKDGEARPSVMLRKHKGRKNFYVAALPLADARKLADQIHDACDEIEREQRESN